MTTHTPDSTKVVHYTYADLSARQISRPVHIVQYDSSLPILAVKLYNDGQPYTIPSNADVNIRLTKADGNLVYNPALGWDSERQTVFIEVTKQMAVLYGEVNPVIEIVVGTKTQASGPICVMIDRNPIQQLSIESTNEYITAKEYATEAVDAAARASSSASSASTSANNANSYMGSAKTYASNAQGYMNNANSYMGSAKTYMDNAKSYMDSAASSKNSASASQSEASKSETKAANYASQAQAAYEEILGADVGKFGTQLAVEHSVIQPLCDSSGESLLDSSGNNLSGRVIFADEGEIVILRQTVTNLESVVKDLVNKLIHLRNHALLDDQY